MTLTVCVGASGSGKTTFLNDVHKSHKCTYIRQYHNLRPYITVSAIPNFDPTKLPYWDTYVREKKDRSIIVGGTIAGQFMPGLSGGQRKLLLFELIFQRTAAQDNLLIVLDEPFAGVTDDFVPFIVDRLNEMRVKHNVLLVTNDHVDTLKAMADNTVTVSAIDRSKVKINGKEGVARDLALLAMSIGDDYVHGTNDQDLAFFGKVEFSKNGGILAVVGFAVCAFGMFLLMFWDSKPGMEPLVLVAAGLISFFSLNPYFLQLGDWRVFMIEEAEALLHSSKGTNKALKSCLTLALLLLVTCVQFGCQCAVITTISTAEIFVGILFDNFMGTISLVLLGLYTNLTFEKIQILGSMPFLMMVFFSTTFSPGAGVKGLKELRYLFPRFYLWCMLPDGEVIMEGCPASNTLLYLVLSALLVPFLFVAYKASAATYRKFHREKKQLSRRESMKSLAFAELQMELFGQRALKNLKHIGSTHDLSSLAATVSQSKHSLVEKRTVDQSSHGDGGDSDDGRSSEKGYNDFLSFVGNDGPSSMEVAGDAKV
jgi:ABC-type lipoprotein export system ATPase subunit